jgi:hypothetical protein
MECGIIGLDYGGLRVPDSEKRGFEDFEKTHDMLRNYFPLVQFSPLKNYDKNSNNIYTETIPDELYIAFYKYREEIDNKYYLDIPRVLHNKIFKPLFPLVVPPESINELKNMKESKVRPDIIRFFLDKDVGKFTDGLNSFLDNEAKMTPGFLTNEFLKRVSLSYSFKTEDVGKMNFEFTGDYSNIGYMHDKESVYAVFKCYSHKNCTLYLFGADFLKFMKYPQKWPIINNKTGKTLPIYLCKSQHEEKPGGLGLAEKFQDIEVNDFIWEGWDEAKNKKHLLEKFDLDVNLDISMKEIHHSFCIPLFRENDYSMMLNDERFIEVGYAIIKNILLRNIKRTKAEQIRKFKQAWYETINYVLEGTPDDTCVYNPTMYERFIKQVAGYKNKMKGEEEKERAQSGEYLDERDDLKAGSGSLDNTDRTLINGYFNEIYDFVSHEERKVLDEINRDGNAFTKIRMITKLLSHEYYAYIKEALGKVKNDTIKELYNKAYPASIEEEMRRISKNDKLIEQEDESEKKIDVIDEWLKFEDESGQTLENAINLEDAKKIITKCLLNKFTDDDEIKWIESLYNKASNILLSFVEYLPDSNGEFGSGIKSDIFTDYCDFLNVKNENRNTIHTRFQGKMRKVSVDIKTKLKEKYLEE